MPGEHGSLVSPDFYNVHFIETSDGRRWSTLGCAAHSSIGADRPLSATDTVTGERYTAKDLERYWKAKTPSLETH